MREISALTLAALLLSVSLKIAEHNHFDLQTRQFLKDDDQDQARFENKWLHSKGTGIREQTIAVDVMAVLLLCLPLYRILTLPRA